MRVPVPSRTLALFVVLACLGFSASACRAQSPNVPVAWEKQLPRSIDWYVRTSEGILLVRAGETLSAIDGVDGRQLWSLPYIEIERGGRGKNMLEAPGLSILLINRAKLSAQDASSYLLGVDLWSGKILWQQPSIDDLFELVPFYARDRVLLVTMKARLDKKTQAVILGAEGAGCAFGACFLYVPNGFRPEMTFLDPRTGRADWTAEYPRYFSDYINFQELDGQIYLDEPLVLVAHVDTSTGHKTWEFRKEYQLPPSVVPTELELAGGRVIYAAKDMFAFDPASEEPVWADRHLGTIHGFVVAENLILSTGTDGAYAINSGDGTLRWKVRTSGPATNPLFYKKENALAFCDSKNLVLVNAATGRVLRRTPHHLASDPEFIRPVGTDFVLVFGDQLASLMALSSGERLDTLSKPEREFRSVTFLVNQVVLAGDPDPPSDLKRQLQDAWQKISLEEAQNQLDGAGLARLQPFLTGDSSALYATKAPGGEQGFLRIDTVTGTIEQFNFNLKGSKIDASPALGLIYSVDGDRLRAVRIPTS